MLLFQTHKNLALQKKNCFVFIVFIDVKTVWCQRSALLKWVCRCTGFVKKNYQIYEMKTNLNVYHWSHILKKAGMIYLSYYVWS